MKWKNLTMPKQVVPDAGNTDSYGRFVIEPLDPPWGGYRSREGGKRPARGFRYSSDSNEVWLSAAEMKELAGE